MQKYRLRTQLGWSSYTIGHVYDTNVDPYLGMHVLNHPMDWELVEDDFVLSEKWSLKITDENREMAMQWRNSMCDEWFKDSYLNIGFYILSKHMIDDSYYFAFGGLYHNDSYKDYTELTTEQFITHVYNPKFKSNKIMSTQKLTVSIQDVLKIHSIACTSWKSRIAREFIPRVDNYQNIKFTQSEIDVMFEDANGSQLPILEQIFGKRSESIQWDKIKTGSKVMIQYDGEHCSGFGNINIKEPVDVVFYKTPHYIDDDSIDDDSIFKATGSYPSYCTFHQIGKYVLFSSDEHTNYIKQVIEY